MNFGESLLSAVFVVLVVFSVLVILWGLIRIFSVLIGAIEDRGKSAGDGGSGV
ncbi:MAG: hypothetical protein LBQ21_07655 [Clostridiales Family XIII bacterium]|nr:hypothetical protein [Clostridiales Family XIII bacterium]